MVLPTGYRPEKGVYRPDEGAKRSKIRNVTELARFVLDTFCKSTDRMEVKGYDEAQIF